MGRVSLATIAREIASDALLIGGTAALCFGAWQVYPPAAWMLGGICASAYGYLIGRGA